MLWIDLIAEARIGQAQREGAFEDLPGAGQPIDLDDDPLVPEEMRVAYRILKNAGFLPPEIEARREIAGLRAALSALEGEPARRRAAIRLALLQAQLERRGTGLAPTNPYYQAVVDRFDTGR